MKSSDEAIKWRLLIICTVCVVLLCAIIFAIRFSSVLKCYDLFRTSGDEEFHVYGIWKVQNGYPLYEYPNRIYYNLIGYNYLFYYFYAWILSAFHITNEGILLYGKLLTLSFAFLGALVHWHLMRYLLRRHLTTSVSFVSGMIAFIVWFGPHLTGWWTLTNRPDIAAASISTLATLIYMRGSDSNYPFRIILSSILFFVGWAFKQSYIWAFAGVILYISTHMKDWKRLFIFIGPFALCVIASFIIGGERYWLNTVVANLGQDRSLFHFLHILSRTVLVSPFLWAMGIYVAPLVLKRYKTQWERENEYFVLCMYIAIVGFLGAAYAAALVGTNKNQFIESYISAATLSALSLAIIRDLTDARRRAKALTVALSLMVCMALFPIAQLALFNRAGSLSLASEKEYRDKRLLADYMRSLPKPLYFHIFPFGLPWYATNNAYPMIYFDTAIHLQFKNTYEDGLDDLVAIKYFGSMIIDINNPDNLPTCLAALKAGYLLKRFPRDIDISYILREWNSIPLLYVFERETG